MPANLKSIERPIALSLYGLLFVATILSLGDRLFWSYPLELLSSFKVYYLLLSGTIAIAAIVCHYKGLRVKLLIYLALGLFAFNSMAVLPWYLPHQQTNSGKTIRVLTFNINIKNDRWDDIADAILAKKPDVVTIIESSSKSKQELSLRLHDLFPHAYRTSGGDLTIFSRFPLISTESKTFASGTILIASLQVDRTIVEFIAAHPIVPIKPNLFQRRNAALADISAYIARQKQKSIVLMGDLNITPWSPYYKRAIRQTNLQNTRMGFGIEPSWMEATTYDSYPDWVAASIKIPIDHILVSKDIEVVDCKTSRAANADHRMLWSDLSLQ